MGALGTFYDTLGVPESVDQQGLRTAYLRLIRDVHPDNLAALGSPDCILQTAAEVNEAYNALKNQSRRAAYDQKLARERYPLVDLSRMPPPSIFNRMRASFRRVTHPPRDVPNRTRIRLLPRL